MKKQNEIISVDFTSISNVFIFVLFFSTPCAFSQSVGIFGSTNLGVNNTGAKGNVKAVFDISSPDKGLLIPRVTTASRDTFTNIPTSLLIFNTTTNQYEYFNSGTWVNIASGGGTLSGGTINYIPKWTSATSLSSTSLLFDDGTNMGIGTTSPGKKLEVRSGNWEQIALSETSGGTTKSFLGLYSPAASAASVWEINRNPTSGTFTDVAKANASIMLRSLSGDGNIVFATGNVNNSAGPERMRIDKNGNIGIGTTSPAGTLEIAGTTPVCYLTRYSSDVSEPYIIFRKARGTSGSPSAVLSGDVLGQIQSNAYYTSAFSSMTAGIRFNATENFTSTAWGTNIDFFTVPNGSTTALQRMKIDHNGNVGIGTTTVNQKLELKDGNILLSNSGTAGQIRFAEPSASGVNYSAFKAQAQATDITYTLPASLIAGSFLSTDGSGNLSWAGMNGTAWTLIGNSSTIDGTNFIGTTDNIPLAFRVNNQFAGKISSAEFTFLGYGAGNASMTGTLNTAFGANTFSNNTTGSNNTSIGVKALFNNLGGTSNTAVGIFALQNNLGGGDNNAMGYGALGSNTNGGNNNAIGVNALTWNLTGTGNTAMGQEALFNTTGSYNTAFGYRAGKNNNTTANNNTFIGANADLSSATQRTNATAIGYNARVDANNALILGGTGADAVNVGIGTTAPRAKLETYIAPDIAMTSAIFGGYGKGIFNGMLSGVAIEHVYPGIHFNGYHDGTDFRSIGSGYGGQIQVEPTGGNMYFNFFSNAASADDIVTATTRMLIQNNGNVGIGTTSPNAKLDVSGTVRLNDNDIYFRSTTDVNHGVGWHGTGKLFAGTNVDGPVLYGWSGGVLGTMSGGARSVLYWNSAGNIGIGTTAPLYRLNIQGTGGTTGFVAYNNSTNGYPYVGVGYDQTNDGLAFRTNVGSTDLNGTAMYLARSTGRLGIGTITPGGQFELSLDQGRKPSTNTWTIVSDARLKNIEGAYSKGLKEILQLNPITYHYKSVEERKFSDEVTKTLNVGFSAQEVQKIFPEAVGTDADGYLNFNMHSILVAYVNAIKEQQKIIDSLKLENKNINANNDILLNQIKNLKTELENFKTSTNQIQSSYNTLNNDHQYLKTQYNILQKDQSILQKDIDKIMLYLELKSDNSNAR